MCMLKGPDSGALFVAILLIISPLVMLRCTGRSVIPQLEEDGVRRS